VGRDLKIKVGGNCTLGGQDNKTVVFCAGGIGVSPVLGNYRDFLSRRQHLGNSSANPKSMFLYSVSTQTELVFGEELAQLFYNHQKNEDRMIFTLTKSSCWQTPEKFGGWNSARQAIELRIGRYLCEFLDAAPTDAVFYICGPPAMNDDAVAYLEAKGIPSANMKYEKWW